MPPAFELPKIYPITDRNLSGLSHYEQTRQLIQAGSRFIQVREKSASSGEFYEECRRVVELAKETNTTIIVNDRADIVTFAEAHGVHVGQDDLPPEALRKLLGEDAIIGFSTHNIEQAIAASQLPVDYIAIGPIFATTTKQNPDPVVGLEGLARVRQAIGPNFPLVAIGGIDHTNITAVLNAGADSAAVISCLFANAKSIGENYSRLTDSLSTRRL